MHRLNSRIARLEAALPTPPEQDSICVLWAKGLNDEHMEAARIRATAEGRPLFVIELVAPEGKDLAHASS